MAVEMRIGRWREDSVLYVLVNPNRPEGIIFNCWTALDSQGRRGPVYGDLSEEIVADLRSKGYTVEVVSKDKVDEKGF